MFKFGCYVCCDGWFGGLLVGVLTCWAGCLLLDGLFRLLCGMCGVLVWGFGGLGVVGDAFLLVGLLVSGGVCLEFVAGLFAW